MTDKDLQKLKRADLFEVLLEQSKTIDNLKLQIEEKNEIIASLNKKLEERKINLQEAGTIAEASFKLNGVFETAEKAAQQYLENLKELHDYERNVMSVKEEVIKNRCEALVDETQKRCISMKESTVKECEELLKSVKKRCQSIEEEVEIRCKQKEREAKERCAYLYAKTKEVVEKCINELSENRKFLHKSIK